MYDLKGIRDKFEGINDIEGCMVPLLKTTVDIYPYLSERLQNDRRVALRGITEELRCMQYLPEIFLQDNEFFFYAINSIESRNPFPRIHEDQSAQNESDTNSDENFVPDVDANAIIHMKRSIAFANMFHSEREEYNRILGNNRAVLLRGIAVSPCVIAYASETLKNDKAFNVEAFNINKRILVHVTKAMALSFMNDNGMNLRYVDFTLARDLDIICAALTQNPAAKKYVPQALENDPIVLACLENRRTLGLFAAEDPTEPRARLETEAYQPR